MCRCRSHRNRISRWLNYFVHVAKRRQTAIINARKRIAIAVLKYFYVIADLCRRADREAAWNPRHALSSRLVAYDEHG